MTFLHHRQSKACLSLWMFWAFCALFLAGCGKMIVEDETGSGSPSGSLRRLYLHDGARNDSLPAALVESGVRFVMQPGKTYAVQIQSAESKDRLALFTYRSSGSLRRLNDIPAVVEGAVTQFYVNPALNYPEFYIAQLLPPDGRSAKSRFSSVRLISLETAKPKTLKLKLMMVGNLGLSYNSAEKKQAFSDAFFSQLSQIFAGVGIQVESQTLSVGDANKAYSVIFTGDYTPLPGERTPGYIHLYLLSDITLPATSTSSGGVILGFSPREAIDLSDHPESRVILNSNFSATRLATTAAHEMGHYLGLRHTSATAIDMQYDQDASNNDDGFVSTPFCAAVSTLPNPTHNTNGWNGKVAATSNTHTGDAAPPAELAQASDVSRKGRKLDYCLRIQVDCPDLCELSNLMFPYDCNRPQRQITSEQADFLSRNLGVLQKL